MSRLAIIITQSDLVIRFGFYNFGSFIVSNVLIIIEKQA